MDLEMIATNSVDDAESTQRVLNRDNSVADDLYRQFIDRKGRGNGELGEECTDRMMIGDGGMTEGGHGE